MRKTEIQEKYIGQALERVEDAALLTGQGRFLDDLPTAPGTAHAAILRSPHAHAEIIAIDVSRAEALAGVHAVVCGADAKRWSEPFLVGVKQPMAHWCIATDRVRYVGEPVAIVAAESRYIAEDAVALIEVEYRILPAVVEVTVAMAPGEGWLIFGLPPSEVAVHPDKNSGKHELFFMCESVEKITAQLAEKNIPCSAIEDLGWGLLTRLTLPGGGDVGVYEPRHERPPSAG